MKQFLLFLDNNISFLEHELYNLPKHYFLLNVCIRHSDDDFKNILLFKSKVFKSKTSK